MAKMKVLVTGGAGYLGATLCRELLASGYEVAVYDNLMYGGESIKPFLNHPHYKFVKGDIRDQKLLKKSLEKADSLVHLAAIVGDEPGRRNPSLTMDVNLDATKACYTMAKEMGLRKFLFASTCSNYGISSSDKPVSETAMLNPVSLYAETKVDCETFLLREAPNTSMTTPIFRFGTAFGLSGRNRFDLLINSFTYEAMRDGKMMVFVPYSWRPYIHVLDICRVLILALEVEHDLIHGQVFNAGSTSMNYQKFEIVEAINKVLGGGIVTKLVEGVDDPRTYRVDFNKIETLIDFKPCKTIEDGISEIVDSIRNGVITSDDFDTNTLDNISEIAKNFK